MASFPIQQCLVGKCGKAHRIAGSSVSAFKLKLCNLLQRFCVSVSLVFRQSSLGAGVSFCCRMYKYLVETGHLRPPSITHDGCDLVKQRGRNHLCLRRRHGCYVVTSSRTSDGCDRVRPRNKRGRTRSHPPLPWKATIVHIKLHVLFPTWQPSSRVMGLCLTSSIPT